MLKGISIYPETLSNKKKINRLRRDKSGPAREGGSGGNLLVDAAEAGLVGPNKAPDGPPQVEQLPIKVDYGDELSPDQSLTPAGSKTSSPSSPGDDVLLGDLTFSVDYNFPKKALVVTIQEAHGLPVMDEHTQSSDPYIKMTILPDKRHRVKTRVLRKTLEPVFDETFTFYGIPYSHLQDLVLHFLVLSFDRFSRDDVIGEVMVPLAGVDPSTGKVQLTREILKRNIQKCISRGELQVSLSYQPVAQRMTVVVLKARHLPKMDITGLSGRSYFLHLGVGGRSRNPQISQKSPNPSDPSEIPKSLRSLRNPQISQIPQKSPNPSDPSEIPKSLRSLRNPQIPKSLRSLRNPQIPQIPQKSPNPQIPQIPQKSPNPSDLPRQPWWDLLKSLKGSATKDPPKISGIGAPKSLRYPRSDLRSFLKSLRG
uniref:Synaptotagmin 11 n=1 Tax=Serinus canaria TaxID=9135 RepID=A0A8C9MYM7_SERCA